MITFGIYIILVCSHSPWKFSAQSADAPRPRSPTRSQPKAVVKLPTPPASRQPRRPHCLPWPHLTASPATDCDCDFPCSLPFCVDATICASAPPLASPASQAFLWRRTEFFSFSVPWLVFVFFSERPTVQPLSFRRWTAVANVFCWFSNESSEPAASRSVCRWRSPAARGCRWWLRIVGGRWATREMVPPVRRQRCCDSWRTFVVSAHPVRYRVGA